MLVLVRSHRLVFVLCVALAGCTPRPHAAPVPSSDYGPAVEVTGRAVFTRSGAIVSVRIYPEPVEDIEAIELHLHVRAMAHSIPLVYVDGLSPGSGAWQTRGEGHGSVLTRSGALLVSTGGKVVLTAISRDRLEGRFEMLAHEYSSMLAGRTDRPLQVRGSFVADPGSAGLTTRCTANRGRPCFPIPTWGSRSSRSSGDGDRAVA